MKLLISLLTSAGLLTGTPTKTLPAAPAPQAALDQTAAPVEMLALREPFDSRAALARANASLNSVKTAEGRFTQIAPDGSVSEMVLP